ncbi:MAG TPA: Fic family protein [Luteolibacter sp.]|nr:Fic family protein [Luteolibacter sp.]
MPKIAPFSQLDDIVRAVELFPLGVAVSTLLERPELQFSKRTLQRRLEQLVHEGRLAAIGRARARRYTALASVAAEEHVLREEPAQYAVRRDWLTPAGREVQALVSRSLIERSPVGYRPEFLTRYEPNVTFYLPPELRRNLAEIGYVGLRELPAGTYLRQLMNRLLIDLSWNSSRLEGNTYSLLETQRLLEEGVGAEGHGVAETQMLINHKGAIEMLAEQAEELCFNRYTVCNLHAMLAHNLMPDPADCGRIRSVPVGIGGTVYHPLSVPQKIEECFDLLLAKAEAIVDPFEQAFFVMVHIPYLQPFGDVNKRVSRIVANIPLMRHNLCPLSFVDVDKSDYVAGLIGVYEMNRVELLRDVFEWSYRRSCLRYSAVRQIIGEPDPFRMMHRNEIAKTLVEVVTGRMDKAAAIRHIAKRAAEWLPAGDRARFTEVVENELRGLHEGNLMRLRLRPSEFHAWKQAW